MKETIKIKSTMIKNILIGLALIFAFSCNKDNDDDFISQEKGIIWLSGGVAFCAEQIHLDNGDTLIVNIEDVISFVSGDRVSVKYKELGINESCPSGLNCEIVNIIKI
jgi:hypothetical protein